jgi:hypothetical protein
MNVGKLMTTLDEMLRNAIIMVDSEIHLRTIGNLAPDVEIVTEKSLDVISAQDLPTGLTIVKLIGIEANG